MPRLHHVEHPLGSQTTTVTRGLHAGRRALAAIASALFALVTSSAAPALAEVTPRVGAQWVTPVAAPQNRVFGSGGSLSAAVETPVLPWLSLGAGATATLVSLVAPSLPEGVQPPTRVGGWFGLDAAASIVPNPAPARLSPFLDLAISAGISGDRLVPTVHGRAGVVLRLAPWAIGASVGYWRLFDLVPSPLAGDGQFFTLGFDVRRTFAAPQRAARRTVPTPRRTQEPRRCPEYQHTLSSDVDHDGCPDPDSDQDQITDSLDRCAHAAEDRDGFEDDDGCPDPDNDHDAIGDTVDLCPNAAEIVNGVDDSDGCPDEALAHVEHGRVEYTNELRFFFNSVRITPGSAPVLRAIATLLRAHPEFAVVYVEGHADSIGDGHYNFRLSLARARAVIDELANLGVPRARFVPTGYGFTQPEALGRDARDRAINRRVEFVLDGRRREGRALTPRGYAEISRGATP
jgi:outer membrane protein OmpA-like peptidoglycan-associated protein